MKQRVLQTATPTGAPTISSVSSISYSSTPTTSVANSYYVSSVVDYLKPAPQVSFTYTPAKISETTPIQTYNVSTLGNILPESTYINQNEPYFVPYYKEIGNSGKVSSVYGYDAYQIQASTFTGASFTFDFTSNADNLIFKTANSNQYIIQGSDVNSSINILAPTSISSLTTSSIINNVIDTNIIQIDNQTLTADSTNLFLNGIPLVTSSNISSLSQWSYDPAISDVNIANYNIKNVSSVFGKNAFFSTVNAQEINTNILHATSTIQSYEYISTGIVNTDIVRANTVSTVNVKASLVSSSIVDANSIYTNNITAYDGTIDALNVSSINGAEFTQEAIKVPTLNADSISTAVGYLAQATVSSFVFNPTYSNNINLSLDLGLGAGFGELVEGFTEGIFGALVTVPLTVGTALYGLTTGITAGIVSRNGNTITNNYEMINGTTQLQISTLGEQISTIYRVMSTIPSTINISTGAITQVNTEIFVSTLSSANPRCIRSVGDPVQLLNQPWTYTQAVGQWVEIPKDKVIDVDSVVLSPSTILTSAQSYSGLEVKDFQGNYTQVNADALRLVDNGSNGIYYFASAINRPGFVDANGSSHTLAYTTDLISSFSTFAISTVNVENANVSSLTVSTLKTQALNANYLTNSISAYDPETNTNHSLTALNFLEANAVFTQVIGTGLGAGSNSVIGITANFLMSEDRNIYLKHNEQSTIVSGTGIITSDLSSITLQTSSINGINPYDWAFSSNLTSSISGVELELISSVSGLGTAGYISSTQLVSTVDNLTSTISNGLISTTSGLGTAGYISSAQLVSTVEGIELELISTTSGLGTAGYISSTQLVSTVDNLTSTISNGLISTTSGLGTAGYISSTQLTSSIAGVEFELNSSITATQLEFSSSISTVNLNLVSSVSSLEYQIASASSFGTIYISTANTNIANANLIIVGGGGGGYTSNFTSSIVSTFTSNAPVGGSPIYMAFGQNNDSQSLVIQRSSDAKNWSASGFGTSFPNNVAYFGDFNPTANMWVCGANGSGTSIKYSMDNGITWANANTTYTGACYRVRWVPERNVWVSAGFGNGQVGYSSNGIDWTIQDIGAVYGWDITYSPTLDRFVLAIFGGTAMKWSDDLTTWNNGTGVNINYGQACWWNSYNNKFYGGGDQNGTNTVQYSTDGKSWTNINSGGYDYGCFGLHNNGNIMLAGGGFNPKVLLSTDGSNFSSAGQTGTQDNDVQDFAYDDTIGLWVSIGRSGNPQQTVKWSSDASNWQNPTTFAGMQIGGILHGVNTATSGGGISTIQFQSTFLSTIDVFVPGTGGQNTTITPSSILASTMFVSSFYSQYIESSYGSFNNIITNELSTNSISTSQINSSNIDTTKLIAQEIYASTLYVQQEIISTSIQVVNLFSTISTDTLSANSAYIDTLSTNLTRIEEANVSSITTDFISAGLAYADVLVGNSSIVNRLVSYEIVGSNIYNYSLSSFNVSAGQAVINKLQVNNEYANSISTNFISAGQAYVDTFAFNTAIGNNISTNFLSANQAYVNQLSTNKIQAQNISVNTLVVYGSNTLINQGSTILTGATNLSSLAITGEVQMNNNLMTVGTPDTLTSNYVPLYVAGGSATTKAKSIRISTDSSNWVDSTTGVGLQANYLGIAYGNNKWVAVGQYASTDKGIQYSTDAFSWQNANSDFTARYGVDVQFLNGEFWACGIASTRGQNNLKRSTDGINWTNVNVPNMDATLTIGYNNGLYVVSGQSPNSNDNLQWSSNGTSWTSSTGQGFQADSFDNRGIAYGAGVWVAVGQAVNNIPQESILWSTDGKQWNSALSGGFGFWSGFDVAFNGSYFVAVGYGDATNNMILKSLDGKAWTTTLGGFPNYAFGVAWTGTNWIATGGSSTTTAPNNIKYSSNGSFWNNANGLNFYQGITPTGRGVAVGSNIQINTITYPKTYITNSNISTSDVYSSNVFSSNVYSGLTSTLEVQTSLITTNDLFANQIYTTGILTSNLQAVNGYVASTFTKSISSGIGFIDSLTNKALSTNSISAGIIQGDISTNNISIGQAYIDTLTNKNISTQSISSAYSYATLGEFSNINTNYLSANTITASTLLIEQIVVSTTINQVAVVSTISTNFAEVDVISVDLTKTSSIYGYDGQPNVNIFANFIVQGANTINTNTISVGQAYIDTLRNNAISTNSISAGLITVDSISSANISTNAILTTSFSASNSPTNYTNITNGTITTQSANIQTNINTATISATNKLTAPQVNSVTISNTGNIKTNNISSIFTSTAELYTSSIRTSALDGTTIIHDAYINTQYLTAQGFITTNQVNTSGLLANQVYTNNIFNESSITTNYLSTNFLSANTGFIRSLSTNNIITNGISTNYISASSGYIDTLSTNRISTNDIQVRNICTFGTAYFADLVINGAQKFNGYSTITNNVANASYPINDTAFSVYNIIYSQNTTITASPPPGTGYVLNIVASNSGTQSRNITFDPLYYKTTGSMNLGANGLGVINFISFGDYLIELSRRINV